MFCDMPVQEMLPVALPQGLVVVTPDFQDPVQVGAIPDGAVFTNEFPTTIGSPLLLVNVPSLQAVGLIGSYVEAGIPVFYQADAAHVGEIVALLEQPLDVAVKAAQSSAESMLFRFGQPSSEARPATDLARGLALYAQLGKRASLDSRDQVLELTQPTVAGLLITQITPLAKKVKPYLPTRLVVALYRLIARLR